MSKDTSKLYMKLGGFKKISGQAPSKARSMNILSKIALQFTSGKVLIALALVLLVGVWVNDNIRKTGVPPKCWFNTTGETAVAKGVITSIEFISLGVKNQNNFRILYDYNVNGTTYRGVSFQTGLGYRKNEAIEVTYSTKDPSCSCCCGKCPAEDAMFTVIFGGVLLLIAAFLIQASARRMIRAIWIIEHGAIAAATVRSITRKSKIVWTMKYARTVIWWNVSCEFKDASGNSAKVTVNAPSKDYVRKGDSIAVVYDPGMPDNVIAVDALPFFVKTDPELKA